MKECRYCKKSYPESYFGVALTTDKKVYRRHKCKFCYQEVKNILRRKKRTWLVDYKKNCRCNKCGVNDFRVLEFHHLDKQEKEFSLSWAHDNKGIEHMKEEMKKCIILCANCHRILHWEELNK
jgi:hypothetical protein